MDEKDKRIQDLEKKLVKKQEQVETMHREITELRLKLTGISEVLDDIIESQRECRQALVQLQTGIAGLK